MGFDLCWTPIELTVKFGRDQQGPSRKIEIASNKIYVVGNYLACHSSLCCFGRVSRLYLKFELVKFLQMSMIKLGWTRFGHQPAAARRTIVPIPPVT